LRSGLALILGFFAACPGAANADAGDAANWARLRGCGSVEVRTALQVSPLLQQAAARLAAGAQLREALASLGYLAAQSSALHLTGPISDAQVSRALTAGFCATLTNPQFHDIGVARHGREVWLVLAQPVAVPTGADASVVSQRMLELVNAARAAGRRCGHRYFPPVPPLALNANLTASALAHSQDMAQHGQFDHTGHDGSTPELRVRRAGYGPYRIIGENIAAGAMSAPQVTEGWLASPPHCENIMDGRFTQIGIAFAANLRASAGIYWTQDFAAPRGR
jgi:uncharacterized protein YkwD